MFTDISLTLFAVEPLCPTENRETMYKIKAKT